MKVPCLNLPLCSLAVCAFFLTASSARAASLAVDESFNPPRFVEPNPAQRMELLPDGKFLRFFNADTLVGQPSAGPLTRYLSDGTLDNSFHFTGYRSVSAVAPLADGKLIIAALQDFYEAPIERILRLNSDGSIDSSFAATDVEPTTTQNVAGIVIQPDGKILVSGFFFAFANENREAIVRLLPDGGLDTSFVYVPLYANTTGQTSGFVAANKPLLQADGKIILYGNFRRIGSTQLPTGIGRLNSDGTVDTSFQPTGFTRVVAPRGAILQTDGKILVGGRFSVTSSFAANPTGSTYNNLPIIRLTSNGAADQTYGCFNAPTPPTTTFNIRDLALQGDGKAVASDTPHLTVYRFETNGSRDTSLQTPQLAIKTPTPFSFTTPVNVRVQADQRILLSGTFTDIGNDGTALDDSHYGIVRLETNGAVDQTLTTASKTGFTKVPTSFARQADGSTLIAFRNSNRSLETSVPQNVARLQANGAVDLAFHPFVSGAPLNPSFVADGLVQTAPGAFFIFGTLGSGAYGDGRIFSDGTQDMNFTSDLGFGAFEQATPVADGKVLVTSSTPDGLVRQGPLARLNADGTGDDTFAVDAEVYFNQVVRQGSTQLVELYAGARVLAVLPDGKLIFVFFAAQDRRLHLVRLNADGSVDDTFTRTVLDAVYEESFPVVFDPINGTTQQVTLYSATVAPSDALRMSNGRIILAGAFTSFAGAPARGLARIQSEGTLDTSFHIGGGAQWVQTTGEYFGFFPFVEQIEAQPDGKLLIAGTFEAFNGVPAPGLAALDIDGAVDSSFVSPVVRQKSAPGSAILARQPDDSFLLSGPYSTPSKTAPSFVRLVVAEIPPRIISIARNGSAIVVTFDAQAGRTYRLERKLHLSDPDWQSIPGVSDVTPAGAGPAQLVDPTAGNLPAAFYHVRLLQ